VFSSFPFPPDDRQRTFVTKDGVVEKHVPRHIVDVVTFPNALRVMLGSDEADGDSAQLAVPFFHETTGANLRDKFGHFDPAAGRAFRAPRPESVGKMTPMLHSLVTGIFSLDSGEIFEKPRWSDLSAAVEKLGLYFRYLA